MAPWIWPRAARSIRQAIAADLSVLSDPVRRFFFLQAHSLDGHVPVLNYKGVILGRTKDLNLNLNLNLYLCLLGGTLRPTTFVPNTPTGPS